jgi:hypothetical protein
MSILFCLLHFIRLNKFSFFLIKGMWWFSANLQIPFMYLQEIQWSFIFFLNLNLNCLGMQYMYVGGPQKTRFFSWAIDLFKELQKIH